MPVTPVYSKTIAVPQSAIDENGHVNNVTYVQWMQDIAVDHYTAIGGVGPTQRVGATWVARSHLIEYFLPAFAGEEIEVRTWIENYRRVRSLRKYEFVRVSDGKLLVKGETDWVFVDASTGNPRAISEEVIRVFQHQNSDVFAKHPTGAETSEF